MEVGSGTQADGAAPVGLRARKKLSTRQQLARAALRLAVERGPGNVRREDIAAAADVSLRTFSNHFSSKEEAIVSLAVERAAGVVAGLRARPPRESMGRALVAAFAEQHRHAPPDPEWRSQVRVIVSAPEVRGAYLLALAGIEEPLAEAIAVRLGVDARHDPRPRVVAAAACAAERAAIGFWLETGDRTPLAEVVAGAIRQVTR